MTDAVRAALVELVRLADTVEKAHNPTWDAAWNAARAALSEQPAIDMDELRRAVCLIGTVGTIDGHDVIRRNSALKIIDARIDRANS